MRLYHGSNVAVRNPKVLQSQRALDFGAGFYLTTSYEQARRWAELTVKRRREGIATVSSFEIDEEEALKRLLPQKLKDQYVFKTEKAVSLLQIREVIEV